MTIRIPLTGEQQEALSRPVTSSNPGGFGNLVKRLQRGIRYTGQEWVCEMSRDDAGAVVTYSDGRYGGGGYQSRLALIADAVKAELATLPPSESLTLDL